MRTLLLAAAASLLAVASAFAVVPSADVGKPAPPFTLTDLLGKPVSLSDFKGKRVVLEWFNPECPFVVYSHTKGPLRDLADRYTKKGIVWLAVNSGAPGKQGHGVEKNAAKARAFGMKHAVLSDEQGLVGRAYGATATPHMFVIDEKGVLVYAGAIDNAPLGDSSGAAPVNYVEQALEELSAGRPVSVPKTGAYGCSVKYGG